MKITAGLGSIDDYISFVKAGADELFCGYIPEWWTTQYGIFSPLNRREVLYYNVQIGSRSEMEILHDMVQHYSVPVSITLNALYYRPEQYLLLEKYIAECLEFGFDSFIIADFALLVYLKETGWNKRIKIMVSGELSEMNSHLMDVLTEFSVKRIIFHRKMTINEMKACIAEHTLEFEAFALNEKCHFHGGFCHSLHCDEMAHICQVPYKLGSISTSDFIIKESSLKNPDPIIKEPPLKNPNSIIEEPSLKNPDSVLESSDSDYIPGYTGCGFCALWDLRDAGINYLKLVGRGNYSEDMRMDIQAMRQALELLEKASTREEYVTEMKKCIFPSGCSGNCYY